MTVIISSDLLPAARGLLKRWFIEPKPNVFVGSINARTREKTLDYIRRNSPAASMLVIYDDNSSQGYTVLSYGSPDRKIVYKCGLQLMIENPDVSQNAEATEEGGSNEID